MIGGQTLKRRAFPDGCIAIDVVENARFEHEEAPVDVVTVARRLLAETRHRVVVSEVQSTKASLWSDSGQRGQGAGPLMESNQCSDVDVGDAVSVGQQEGFTIYVRPDALDAPSGHRLLTRVDKGHTPVLGARIMPFHAVVFEIDGHVGHVQDIVGKILLDGISFVPKTDDKILNAIGRICLHDMPEDGLATDFNHWLRAKSRLLTQSRTDSSCKDDCLHDSSVRRASASAARAVWM